MAGTRRIQRVPAGRRFAEPPDSHWHRTGLPPSPQGRAAGPAGVGAGRRRPKSRRVSPISLVAPLEPAAEHGWNVDQGDYSDYGDYNGDYGGHGDYGWGREGTEGGGAVHEDGGDGGPDAPLRTASQLYDEARVSAG